MLDPEELERQVVAGFGDRNIMARVILRLASEINKIEKIKASSKTVTDLRKKIEQLKRL